MKFPVVGMQHRFPSAMVLSLIPPGTEFYLVREPDNPHDENAIQVWVDDLPGILTGDDLESINSACVEQEKEPLDWSKPFMLGYIKALSVNQDVVGAEVLAPRIDALVESGAIDSASDIPVILVYGESGRPAVEIVEKTEEDGATGEEEAAVAEVEDADLAEESYEEDEEDEEDEEFDEPEGEVVPEDFTQEDRE